MDGVQQSGAWQTIVKTRIIARNQQVVRVDREGSQIGTAGHSAVAIEILDRLVPDADAVILSDYAKGYLNQQIVDRMQRRTADLQSATQRDRSTGVAERGKKCSTW